MKYMLLLLLVSVGLTGAADASDAPSSLCTTIKYRAFGEPEKTARECFDDNAEMFFIETTLNDYRLPTMTAGLDVPVWIHDSATGNNKTIVGQVLKQSGTYTVRLQIQFDGKDLIASVPIQPGSTQEVVTNGQKILIGLQRKQI